MMLVVKNPPANPGDVRDVGSIPGSGRSPEGGHGNSLQYSCLENPMNRGAWHATTHGITKSQTWLRWISRSAYYPISPTHSLAPKGGFELQWFWTVSCVLIITPKNLNPTVIETNSCFLNVFCNYTSHVLYYFHDKKLWYCGRVYILFQ